MMGASHSAKFSTEERIHALVRQHKDMALGYFYQRLATLITERGEGQIITNAAIANYVGCSKATVTRKTDILVSAGLLAKRPLKLGDQNTPNTYYLPKSEALEWESVSQNQPHGSSTCIPILLYVVGTQLDAPQNESSTIDAHPESQQQQSTVQQSETPDERYTLLYNAGVRGAYLKEAASKYGLHQIKDAVEKGRSGNNPGGLIRSILSELEPELEPPAPDESHWWINTDPDDLPPAPPKPTATLESVTDAIMGAIRQTYLDPAKIVQVVSLEADQVTVAVSKSHEWQQSLPSIAKALARFAGNLGITYTEIEEPKTSIIPVALLDAVAKSLTNLTEQFTEEQRQALVGLEVIAFDANAKQITFVAPNLNPRRRDWLTKHLPTVLHQSSQKLYSIAFQQEPAA